MTTVSMEAYSRINPNILVPFTGYLKFLLEKAYFFIVTGATVDTYYCLFREIKTTSKLFLPN